MTENFLALFCLVDGDSMPFSVDIDASKTVDHLKDAIKTKIPGTFKGVDAKDLTLWRVSIPLVPRKDRKDISLSDVPLKEELDETDDLSEVFPDKLPKKTIHIIVQRPPPLHAPVPSRASTPLPGYLSDSSRPSTPLSDHGQIFCTRIDVANFLDSFVRGEGSLPVTTGPIRGLPRAWRRGFGKAPETRPSLLFLDLPDPSTLDSESKNLAARSILELVKENNRHHIPVFGVSGCGKTRAVIELLSQHWGFYFNASNDDWGSSDVMILHSTVQKHLNDMRDSPTVDRQVNNGYARKTTLLLFLSRILIFKSCLNIPCNSDTFISARWTLLQVCSHVLFDKDIFNILFLQVLRLRHHGEGVLLDLVRDLFEDAKGRLVKRGCLPKIKDDTRLLVFHDEAQTSASISLRWLPVALACPFNTLFWVQSSGSGLKDSSTNFEFLEFPGWTDLESIKEYVSRVRRCLLNDESRRVFDGRLPQDALDMLFDKFVGRFRPAIVAVEKIVEHSERSTWKALIEDTEDKLVAWEYRTIKGNLCRELDRLDQKHKDARHDKSEKTILDILGFYFYRRCFRGEHTLEDDSVNASLVERAFGRIKIVNHNAVTVVDEPFVFKAVENYFTATDPGFQTALKELMDRMDAAAQGNIFERYMMSVFSETFKSRRLSDWPHQPPIMEMCPDLVGEVEIVGWREPALLQGTTHAMMSMEEFMDAHVNHQSTRDNKPVAPFFFPKSKPSGPDLLFFIRINGRGMVPVFVQMKLHQSSAKLYKKLWERALATVSASCIQDHARDFQKFCPDNIYISMVVAYPMICAPKLPPAIEVPKKDARGVQQVVIRVSDANFGYIFPEEHVKFIDRLKNAGKLAADDDDSDDEDRSKKLRT
ncbi:MAG: hypothetical protein J3R72DRAFT_498661 [Linnemannia gamsii]|nr:MAG: hypothetical protein J3R72DRAFT_498661 [Linnemannia gamsii]